MIPFIEDPNLPAGECSVVISAGISDCALKELENSGVCVWQPEAEPGLPRSLQTHADMVFLYLGCGRAVVSDAQKRLVSLFSAAGGVVVGTEHIGDKYPYDVPLNALLLGRILYCNSKYISNSAYKYCRDNGYRICHINQGYAKCSVCVVSQTAVITEDRGVFAALTATGECDALLVSPGYVELPGYDRGFIGGCCGKVSEDILAFNGRIESHPDYRSIRSFCRQHGVEPVSLSNDPLFDNGGILPIAYKDTESRNFK